jgi:hypothetical protein
MRGFRPEKVVVGMVTTPQNGSGFVELSIVTEVLNSLRTRFGPAFGGVMGWEFFNSLPGGNARPWEWAAAMKSAVGGPAVPARIQQPMANPFLMQPGGLGQLPVGNRTEVQSSSMVHETKQLGYVVDSDDEKEEALLPKSFDYFTDGSVDE